MYRIETRFESRFSQPALDLVDIIKNIAPFMVDNVTVELVEEK